MTLISNKDYGLPKRKMLKNDYKKKAIRPDADAKAPLENILTDNARNSRCKLTKRNILGISA
jgi:hypothetical protein